MLQDITASDRTWRISCLRYFNPVGAHESGTIGEDPRGIPSNLLPFVAQVAAGQRKFLNVWGNDYPTFDGTGVRDYIHVYDLAEGHVATLDYLNRDCGMFTVNFGTGRGNSVLEIVKAFEAASGKPVPYKMAPAAPETLPFVTLKLIKLKNCWDGVPKEASKTYVPTLGTSRQEPGNKK